MLRQHFYPHHLRLMEFRCGECRRLFCLKAIAERHIKAIHCSRVKEIKVETVYHCSLVQSLLQIRKVFKGFEIGIIPYSMFNPNGAGLKLSQDDVYAAIEKAVKECNVTEIASPARLQELEKKKKEGLQRVNNMERQTIDALGLKEENVANEVAAEESLFKDSIDSCVAPMDSTVSTITSVHLNLHKRPRKCPEKK